MLRLSLVVILLASLPLAHSRERGTIERLGWMAGCWEQRAGARIGHEQWMTPLGGTMMGMSRTVVRDTTREFEQLRIETVKDGSIRYVAHPSGQAETSFAGITVTDTLVVFENLQHDFPQRIMYRATGADSLGARIEGVRGGTLRGIDFPMQRVRCAGR